MYRKNDVQKADALCISFAKSKMAFAKGKANNKYTEIFREHV